MAFKIVSNRAKTGSKNDPAALTVYPADNRFKLNYQLALLLAVSAADSVTLMYDDEENKLAIFKSNPKRNAKGEVVYKYSRISAEDKKELEAEGKELPTEIDYEKGCKLGQHLEFASGEAITAAGLENKAKYTAFEAVDAAEFPIEIEADKVIIFDLDKFESLED